MPAKKVRQGRPGPPIANLNRVTNGVLISRLTLGQLPKSMHRQMQTARKYRRELEQLLVETKGEVSPTDAHWIDEACQAEIHAAFCRHLLRTRMDTMSTADITKCSEQVLKAKTARNKAVEKLKLDYDAAEDAFKTLYIDKDKDNEAE